VASFVESATLVVKDKSTAQINKINAALKKLFATAKSLKSIKIDVKTGSLKKAIADVNKLNSALRGIKNTRVNIAVTGVATARRQVQALARDIGRLRNTQVRASQAATRAVRAETRQRKLYGAALASSERKKAQIARAALIQKAERENAVRNARIQQQAARQTARIQAQASAQAARQQATAARQQAASQARMQRAGVTGRTPSGVPRIAPPRAPAQPWGAVRPQGPVPVRVVGGGGGGAGATPVTTHGDLGKSIFAPFKGLAADIGERVRAAIISGMASATKEGTKQVAMGEYGLAALQLKGPEAEAAKAAIDAIEKREASRPGGPLLNRGQITQAYAETLPVAAYDPQATAWLVAQQGSLIAMEMARTGKSLDDAREESIKYLKALELAGRLSNPEGKFDYGDAQQYLNALKTISPEIGKELTGNMAFQAMKYSRDARYTANPKAFQALLLTAEEMGASSSGVAFTQAIRQLSGAHVPNDVLGELAKQGLVTTKQITTMAGKKKTVVDEPVDEQGLRANLWQFAIDKLMPRMREQGLDPTNPMDAVKYAATITSTKTAFDLVVSAINRSVDIQRAQERAYGRDPDKMEADASRSLPVVVAGLKSQAQGVMGQAVKTLEPIFAPALTETSKYLQEFTSNLNKATTATDPGERKKAQEAVEGTATKIAAYGAGGLMLKGVMGTAMSAISSQVGTMAGLGVMMDPTANPATQSLAAAGVSLNTAGSSLQAAAGQMGIISGVVAGLGARLGIAGAAGMAGVLGTAGLVVGSAGYLAYTIAAGLKAPELTDAQKEGLQRNLLEGKYLQDHPWTKAQVNKNAIPNIGLIGQAERRVAAAEKELADSAAHPQYTRTGDQRAIAARKEWAAANEELAKHKAQLADMEARGVQPLAPTNVDNFWSNLIDKTKNYTEEQKKAAAAWVEAGRALGLTPQGPGMYGGAGPGASTTPVTPWEKLQAERRRKYLIAEEKERKRLEAKAAQAAAAAAARQTAKDNRTRGFAFPKGITPEPTRDPRKPIPVIGPDGKPIEVKPSEDKPGGASVFRPGIPLVKPPAAATTTTEQPAAAPTLMNLPDRLMEVSNSFATVFSTGATTFGDSLTKAGTTAAETIRNGAEGAGNAYGAAAAAQISAAVANINIQVSGAAPGAKSVDTGSGSGPTK
jgi:hypothetical protein